VLLLAAIHSWVEIEHLLGDNSPLYLFPTTLYIIPCVYAAVVFGVRGAALTALWASFLVVLNLLLWHEGLERAGELAQATWIGVVAVFVGSRVDRERVARRQAESREVERRASEERYRAIMDNVGEPILLLDSHGQVVESNRTAAALLGQSVDELRGHSLSGTEGARIARRLGSRPSNGAETAPIRLGQPPRWFELVPMATREPDGTDEVQVLLRDVTDRYEREQSLASIAREALAAREEEQQRIARELHDGPLQSLVQHMRVLDSLANEAPAPQRGSITAARGSAESMADELRRFSRDLRPSVLDDLGISAAIRSEAESLEQRRSSSATSVATSATARWPARTGSLKAPSAPSSRTRSTTAGRSGTVARRTNAGSQLHGETTHRSRTNFGHAWHRFEPNATRPPVVSTPCECICWQSGCSVRVVAA